MTMLRLLVVALICSLSLFGQSKAAGKKGGAEPMKSAAAQEPGATTKTEQIDINTATPEQLRTVPGIGDAYASKIVAGRPYRAKNELVSKGILPAGVYAKVKDHLIAHHPKAAAAAAGAKGGKK